MKILRGSGLSLSEVSISRIVAPGHRDRSTWWQVSLTLFAATLGVAIPSLLTFTGAGAISLVGICQQSKKAKMLLELSRNAMEALPSALVVHDVGRVLHMTAQ